MEAGLDITVASQVRETEPFGVTDQPAFLNQVVKGVWPGSARDLLTAAKAAERLLGRKAGPRWGPRTADADILLFGDQLIDEPGLQVPHPGITARRFVLEPLAELDPDLRHPVDGRTMAELLAKILGS